MDDSVTGRSWPALIAHSVCAGDRLVVRSHGVNKMGKYVLGWVLGIPTLVLVVIYMIFN